MDSKAKWLLRVAQEEVGKAVSDLPPDLAAQARSVTVVYEPSPGQALLEEGWDPDLLGMFSGATLDEEGEAHPPLPPQILLFYGNLWDFSEEIEEVFRSEVRITYLHELGHFLGLDEEELEDRGLL